MTTADEGFSVVDLEVSQSDDQLRFPQALLPTIGCHANTLAALRIAAGPEQGHRTFASYDKLSQIAVCDERTIRRSLAPASPLIQLGMVKRLGRRHRRTVTLKIATRAAEAFEGKYFALPRCLVLDAQRRGQPFTWAERVLAAVLISKFALLERLDVAEEQDWYSLKRLQRMTGLSWTTILRGRRGLERRGMINTFVDCDSSRGHWPTIWELSPDYTVPASLLSPTAVDILRGHTADSLEARVAAPQSTRATPSETELPPTSVLSVAPTSVLSGGDSRSVRDLLAFSPLQLTTLLNNPSLEPRLKNTPPGGGDSNEAPGKPVFRYGEVKATEENEAACQRAARLAAIRGKATPEQLIALIEAGDSEAALTALETSLGIATS